MKKKTTRFLSVAFAVMFLIFAIPLSTLEASAKTSVYFEYGIKADGTATIKNYTGSAKKLDIPSEIEGHTVTSIGEEAFHNCTSLISITIPDSVSYIVNRAFYGYSNLKEIRYVGNKSSWENVNKNQSGLDNAKIKFAKIKFDKISIVAIDAVIILAAVLVGASVVAYSMINNKRKEIHSESGGGEKLSAEVENRENEKGDRIDRVRAFFWTVVTLVAIAAIFIGVISETDNGTERKVPQNTTSETSESTVKADSSKDSEIEEDTERITDTEDAVDTTKAKETQRDVETTKNEEVQEEIEITKPTHQHSYSKATCTEPAKCSCGATNGSALGHSYSLGTCTRCGAKDPDYDPTYISKKNALEKAKSYSDGQHLSKQRIYDQLVSEYGEKFTAEEAQYAIDNLQADYKKNALEKAKSYSDGQHLSKQRIYDQLVSEYGEKFTAEEAQYAIDNLQADYKKNALEKAKSYSDGQHLSKQRIYDQLVSEYGEKFTAEEAQYAIDNLY